VKTITLPNAAATAALGSALASLLSKGDVIALAGDLGAGKSTLARSIIQTLMQNPVTVPSPSFTLVQHYESPQGRIAHYDWYRLKHAEEVLELGLEDDCLEAITLVEWPERGASFLPATTLWITLTTPHEDSRLATLKGTGHWPERLAGLNRP